MSVTMTSVCHNYLIRYKTINTEKEVYIHLVSK